MSFVKLLTCAALASTGVSQTINLNGQEIPADESNIAPAGELVTRPVSHGEFPLFVHESTQLTDKVLANLTTLGLSHVELFGFDNDDDETIESRNWFGGCKTAPGDMLFPSESVWKVFGFLLGGALKKTVPYASVCFEDWDNYDKAKCDFIAANWVNNSFLHIDDPTSINAILLEDQSCVPPSLFSAGQNGCTVGGLPMYTVDVTNVAHIQLAINMARSLNLRLVVKNTGHDFGAKSTGHGALSIWTHNLKSVEFLGSYKQGSYQGPAFKMGAGVQAYEVYEAAYKNGVTVIGGEGQSVGVMGGYIQGGGHSPLSGIYGMASDQVLSFEVVTASGRVVTASEQQNPDLFWALRGGGGGTYGVVTSAVVKAHPKIDAVSVMTFNFSSGVNNVTDDMFWQAVRAFWDSFPLYARENANYEYFNIAKSFTGTGYTFTMLPWFAPRFSEEELKNLVAPLFAKWTEIGINVDPVYKEYDDFYHAWKNSFPLEPWGSATIRQGSRLLPEDNWADEEITDTTFEVVKSTIEDGNYFIGFNIWAGVDDYPDTAVNPAWRKALVHGISASLWDDEADEATKKAASDKLTYSYVQKMRDVTPGSGAYMSESDYLEPNFTQAFWGTNYEKALAIKDKWDPHHVFYATNAVASERWELQKKIFGNLPNQNSKLCRV